MRFAIHLSCHKFEIFGKKTYNFYFGNSNCVQVKKEYFFIQNKEQITCIFPKKVLEPYGANKKPKTTTTNGKRVNHTHNLLLFAY